MVSNRKYMDTQVTVLWKELERINQFRDEIYEKKHGELVAKVEYLETRIKSEEERAHGVEILRRRIYTVIGLTAGSMTAIVALLDHFFSK